MNENVSVTAAEPVRESQEDRFKRIAAKRINRILGDLVLVENMASGGNYKFLMGDVEKMLASVEGAVERVRQSYTLVLTRESPSDARHSFNF